MAAPQKLFLVPGATIRDNTVCMRVYILFINISKNLQ